jgi:S-adenosylmethionine hydrolase
MNNVVVLFTDFGLNGPYVGLLKLALLRYAPKLRLIDLCHNVPAFDAQSAAYLLAACVGDFPQGAVFVGVVDPGVGGPRSGLILCADDRWYVGPDNGLFDRIGSSAQHFKAWRITWRPERLSASFHGRDLFAPVAAKLASGVVSPDDLGRQVHFVPRNWPNELTRIIYIDDYGNAMTGIQGHSVETTAGISMGQHTLKWERTFSSVPPEQGFWYENSIGLVELAVNQGSATIQYGLKVGDGVQITEKPRNDHHDS